MAHITVLGGTGYAGAAIAAEAAARGHSIVAVSRTAPGSPVNDVSYVSGDATDADFLADLIAKTEVVILSLSPRGSMLGKVKETAEKLIPLAAAHGVRIGVIGGAGSLRVAPDGPRLFDTEAFPEAFKPEAFELTAVWDQLKETGDDVDWFYVSPAAGFGAYNPGSRTGMFRTDASGVLLTDEDGNSNLSAEDLAVAVVDEVTDPRYRRTRFAVAC
ncbi:NAD(P)-dependent oxidoreductase [Nesterenkonia muleiensis]|uniref:NAD(P)-dependent oxidoreductase n=1 Tax=Nesterenkonia muleiensis TaxID=2282648 RepID=UPI000E750D8C|nr:NAD(P)H-binding protein [Nesterenkonia muleiensis]